MINQEIADLTAILRSQHVAIAIAIAINAHLTVPYSINRSSGPFYSHPTKYIIKGCPLYIFMLKSPLIHS